jgi:hypothetical protein
VNSGDELKVFQSNAANGNTQLVVQLQVRKLEKLIALTIMIAYYEKHKRLQWSTPCESPPFLHQSARLKHPFHCTENTLTSTHGTGNEMRTGRGKGAFTLQRAESL